MGKLAAVIQWIEKGAKADDDASKTGSTPLMMAAAMGHLPVMEYLVEKGANLDVQNDKTDKGQKCTALHFAILNQKKDAVKVLVSLGARTDIAMNDGRTVEQLIEGNEGLKSAVVEGKELFASDLCMLAQKGELAVMKAQVRAGKDVDADTSEAGATPLMMAAAMDRLEVIEFLVQSGANLNAHNDKTDKGQKCTALHFAILNQKSDAVELLWSLGARTDIAMELSQAEMLHQLCKLYPTVDPTVVQEVLNSQPDGQFQKAAATLMEMTTGERTRWCWDVSEFAMLKWSYEHSSRQTLEFTEDDTCVKKGQGGSDYIYTHVHTHVYAQIYAYIDTNSHLLPL